MNAVWKQRNSLFTTPVACIWFITAISTLLWATSALQAEKIKGFSHPSGLCMLMGDLYVTDIGKNPDPLAIDGDGTVGIVNDKSEIEQKNILAMAANAKINAPKGICAFNYRNTTTGFSMMRQAIAITDIDKVYAYELIYTSRFFYLDLSRETKDLGGVVSLNDSVLIVAATDKNCLFKININSKAYEKLNTPKIKGAKGLCFDKEKKNLYCVGWGEGNIPNGEIWKINVQSMKIEKLGDDLGYLAGCCVYNNRLYFDDWVEPTGKKGVIRYMDLNTNAIKKVSNVEPIGGPGGLYLDESAKTLFVPAMLEGVIYKVPVD